MSKSKFKKIKIKAIGLTFIVLHSPITAAGLFGPSNFEECVLENMKGQDRALYATAKAACLKAFPPEVVIARDRLKFTWCKSEYDSASVCLEQKPANVTITKVEAVFSEDDCDDAKQQGKPSVVASSEKPWFGSTYKFNLPGGIRKCAIFTFYGIEK
jgi:hypothetical protein